MAGKNVLSSLKAKGTELRLTSPAAMLRRLLRTRRRLQLQLGLLPERGVAQPAAE